MLLLLLLLFVDVVVVVCCCCCCCCCCFKFFSMAVYFSVVDTSTLTLHFCCRCGAVATVVVVIATVVVVVVGTIATVATMMSVVDPVLSSTSDIFTRNKTPLMEGPDSWTFDFQSVSWFLY